MSMAGSPQLMAMASPGLEPSVLTRLRAAGLSLDLCENVEQVRARYPHTAYRGIVVGYECPQDTTSELRNIGPVFSCSALGTLSIIAGDLAQLLASNTEVSDTTNLQPRSIREAADPNTSANEPGAVQKPRILLVEDNRADADLFSIAARRAWGVEPHINHCEYLQHALEVLIREEFDVIYCDLGLPDARGLETVMQLQRAAPRTPFVVLSGSHLEEMAIQSVHLGAQDFLLKDELDAQRLRRTTFHAIERKKNQNQLVLQAHYDLLTGLPNRALFQERLTHATAKARRCGTKTGVLFIDLNKFKPINDTYGHDVGDMILQSVAQRIHHEIRDYDTAARLGGDEFVVLLDTLHDASQAFEISRRIQEAIQRPIQHEGLCHLVSASIGVATFPDNAETTADLVKYADGEMYQHKEINRR